MLLATSLCSCNIYCAKTVSIVVRIFFPVLTISVLCFATSNAPAGASLTAIHALDGCTLASGPTLTVVAIEDGEALTLEDGTVVRLIGAMTPRRPLISLHKNKLPSIKQMTMKSKASFKKPDADQSWPMVRAAETYVSKMVLGKPVTLWTAGRSGNRGIIPLDRFPRDRYGRVLAHVTTDAPSVGERTDLVPDSHPEHPTRLKIWVQAALLRAGLARAYSATDARDCVEQLLRHETTARENRRNIWRRGLHAVRRTDRPDEILKRLHTFQIAEGRVRKVARYRNTTYVNFGTHWRTDFTLVVEGRSHRFLRKNGLELKDLEGQLLRVRGWIEARDGPMMRLTHPEQIERLEPNAKPATLFGSGALAAFDQLRSDNDPESATPAKRVKLKPSHARRSAKAKHAQSHRSRKNIKKKQSTIPKQEPARVVRPRRAPEELFLSM